MSAVLDIDRSGERSRTRLALNPNPQRKYWFDPPAQRNSVEAERRHRQERLAGAFRLFARFGFAQGLAGHITARDPELTDHFWVNPLGVHFSRIKVSDLLLVNAAGETVVGERPLNKAAFAIHAAIHEHDPKIIAARAHAFDLRQGLVDPGPQARHADPGRLRVPRRPCAVRRFHRHGGRRERGPAHRQGAGRAQGRDPQEPRDPERRPERGGRCLVVHRARQRLSHAAAGRGGRRAAADRRCGGAPHPPADRRPEGALHAFESLYEGLVEAEPELLD